MHLNFNEIRKRIEIDNANYRSKDWAGLIGVSVSLVSNIHGKSKKQNPPLPYIIAVARAMKRPVEWYLYGEMPPGPEASVPEDPQVRDAISQLKEIFASNDKLIIPALQTNLAAFHGAIKRAVVIRELKEDVKLLKSEVKHLKLLNEPGESRTGTD